MHDILKNILSHKSSRVLDVLKVVDLPEVDFFEFADLRNVDFKGQDLRGLKFFGAKTKGVKIDLETKIDKDQLVFFEESVIRLLIDQPYEAKEKADRIFEQIEVLSKHLDEEIIHDADYFWRDAEKLFLTYDVYGAKNVGIHVSSEIRKRFGFANNLQLDHLTLDLRGDAGSYLGAFALRGLKVSLLGSTGDYVGRGLLGGQILIRANETSFSSSVPPLLAGDYCGRAANSGSITVAGRVGDYLASYNAGATIVVSGCANCPAHRMQGGRLIICGDTGSDVGLEMSGGEVFILRLGKEERKSLIERGFVVSDLSKDECYDQIGKDIDLLWRSNASPSFLWQLDEEDLSHFTKIIAPTAHDSG